MGVYYSPKIDLAFRKLFGSEENKALLISLINSIVHSEFRVIDLTIKNPYNFAEYADSKSSILDLKALSQSGDWFDIEIQIAGQTYYGKRATYYVSKVFVDQLTNGAEFSSLNRTIGIHLIDFDEFADARYLRRFVFKDYETNEYHEKLGHLQLYFVELKKARKYANDLTNPLNRWIKFLNDAGLGPEGLPLEVKSNREIAQALTKLERMGFNNKERQLYEAEVKVKMVDAGMLDYAKQEGRAEGKEQLVLRLMSRRVGSFPAELADKLDRLTADQLDDLGEALLDFTCYAEVEAWLAAHT